MNGKLPLLDAKESIKIINKMGFELIRQRGSHVYLKHKDGRCTVVPLHSGRDIGRGLLKEFLMRLVYQERSFWNF